MVLIIGVMVIEKKLTRGNLWKQILLFGIPLMASNLLQVLFNMSDIAVVGRFSESGSKAIGAVGSTTILVNLYTGILIGIGSGVNVIVAKFFGAGDKKNLKEAVHTSAIISLFIGVLLAVAGFFTADAFLRLLGTKADLIGGANTYLKIYMLGMPAVALYNFGNGTFSAIGNTKKPLLYLFIAGVLNVGLNLFFVIVFKMDVAGVALASIISQYVSAILVIAALFREKGDCKLSFVALKIHGDKAKTMLALGLPASFQNSIFNIANLFIQSAVNTFPSVVVEGNSAATNSDALVYQLMDAFYIACSSFIGQNFGAGNKKRILHSYLICTIYSFAVGAVLGGGLVLFGKGFLSIFTDDPAVMQEGMARLKIMGFSYCISAFMDTTISASRGLGKTVVSTIIVIMGSCVFRVVWILTIFAKFRTITSIYLLYSCSWTITAIAEIIYFIYAYKKVTGNFTAEAPAADGEIKEENKGSAAV